MAMFVTQERVPVTVEGSPNTIYILPKMNLGARNRLMDELAQIGQGKNGSAPTNISFLMGRYMTALAETNIVGWEGPDFEGVPCTVANIQRLDPDEPLVDAALEEIGRRNPLQRKSEAKN